MNEKLVNYLINTKELKEYAKHNELSIKELSSDDWIKNMENDLKHNYSFLFLFINTALNLFQNKKGSIFRYVIIQTISNIITIYFLSFLINFLVSDSNTISINFLDLLLFLCIFNILYAVFYFRNLIKNILVITNYSLQNRKKNIFLIKINHFITTILSFLIPLIIFFDTKDLMLILVLTVIVSFKISNFNQKMNYYKKIINSIEFIYLLYLFLENDENEKNDLFKNNFKNYKELIMNLKGVNF